MFNDNLLDKDNIVNGIRRLILILLIMSVGCSDEEQPGNPAELFAEAGEAFARGDLQGAGDILLQVTEMDPENTNVWYNLGTVRMEQGLFTEAVEAYQTVLALDSSRVDALTGLTGALTGAGRYGEALHAGSLAVLCNPQDAAAFNNYGMVLMETGDYPSAASCFNTALRRDPEDLSVLYNCGRISALAGEYSQAAVFFDRVLAAAPSHYGARLEMARVSGLAMDHEAAEMHALVLLAEHPDEPEAMEILAAALSAGGRQAEALEILDRLIGMFPANGRYVLGRADCLYLSGDGEAALEEYDRFMGMLSDTAGTSSIRARILELENAYE